MNWFLQTGIVRSNEFVNRLKLHSDLLTILSTRTARADGIHVQEYFLRCCSTDRQDEQSIEAQIDLGQAFARERDWSVVDIYEGEVWSIGMTIPLASQIARDLVRMDTINPPGNEHLCADRPDGLLEAAGFQVARHEYAERRTSLVARLPGGGKGRQSASAAISTWFRPGTHPGRCRPLARKYPRSGSAVAAAAT